MSKPDSSHELFLEELSVLHDAESQLLHALPLLASSATRPELKAIFQAHLEPTRLHGVRLELIVDALGASFRNRTCQAFARLLANPEDDLQAASAADRDAGLIEQARRIEYYVITAYTQVRTHARLLGHGDAEQLLEDTLHEEAVAHVQLMALGRGLPWATNLPAA